jgi:hypothetical protein
MGLEIVVILSFAQRRAVNDRLAIDQPKNANLRFFLPTLRW